MDRRELRRKWEELHNNPFARGHLRPEIADSWARSDQYGINPWMRENPYVATEAEMKEARERSGYLIQVARPIMEHLYKFVAGTGFIVGLVDTNLQALDCIFADHEAQEWRKTAHLVEGGLWSEELVGTNCSALAIALARPISVFGYEHYCLFAHAGAASSAPIFDGDRIIGALAMNGPFDRVSNHTLGMVVSAVKHIESNIVLERASEFHQETIDSISEGLLVLKVDGEILGINQMCAKILRITGKPLIGRNLYELMGHNEGNQHFIRLVTRGRAITDERVTFYLGKDRVQCNITCSPMGDRDRIVVTLRESHKVNHLVRNWIGANAKVIFDDIIGEDPNFCQVLHNARLASSSNSNVLITGESGTGKDLIAQAMHNASPRKNSPFVAINCAALPRDLIASELFGYEDGAFTGARKGGNIGKFELADQGTIFLDEIGDMPLDLQSALLRVIEEKSVMRLGGNKLIPIDVRIIAATNKDITTAINRKSFRPDLYYRLGVIRLNMPPLRERKDDIPILTEYFLARACRQLNKPQVRPGPELIKIFMAYNWPGNVRELQNILESAIQLSPTNELDFDMVQANLKMPVGADDEAPLPPAEPMPEGNGQPVVWSLAEMEKQWILHCLKHHHYNKSETARALGIQRRTLYNRLREYGFQ
ncbi:MAG: sigma-54-dependent Fis family transcriptional regulator [Syntrophomonadales bacterium]|jgi:transcriptional regulator with PAS, ATPase and Fis domain